MRSWLVLALLAGCAGKDDETGTPAPAPDLTERLAAGEVRGGEVVDAASLFGGISAEGEIGDFKLYNDRVAFVIQGMREGDYYLEQGGGVIDADWVRPEGEPGRDIVEEWGPMIGFGRIMAPDVIEVVNDGTDGEAAVIRVSGHEAALSLVEGALEAPGFVPNLGLSLVTEYRLEPDSWLLDVKTEVNPTTQDVNLELGDLLMGAPEVADRWERGTGLAKAGSAGVTHKAYVGQRNDYAVGTFAPVDGQFVPTSVDLVASLVDSQASFTPKVAINQGNPVSFERFWGVGPDLATLSDAWLVRTGQATQEVSGTVTAPDGPVAGARVHVLVDGAPYTIAFTDEAGAYGCLAPAGATVTVRATGRGTGLFADHPEGYASQSAFGAPSVKAEALAALKDGAAGPPMARGRGVASEAEPTVLGEPGTLTVRVADGLPTTVRVAFVNGDPGGDTRWAEPRPDGLAAAGWSQDGEVSLLVPEGEYQLVVHRGQRFQAVTRSVSVVAGEESVEDVSLDEAFTHAGWTLGDPHSHSSPSGDGSVSMEDRLAAHAGGGVQLHFGTDHDRIVDYRPVVEAMGLNGVMGSVVAAEVSPVLRGHVNAYPLPADLAGSNGGAWPWWRDPVESTAEEFSILRELFPNAMFQSNHPLDSGIGDSAGWSPGRIARPSFWTDDFDVLEVINGGDLYFDYYLDLVNHGVVRTPVGVTDSHSAFQNNPGITGTWIGLRGGLAAEDDASLTEAMLARRTVVSRGLFIDASLEPGSVITAPQEVDVTAYGADFAVVSRLKFYVDGVLTETVEGDSATFMLDAPADASFVVVAEGDAGMAPITGRTPWAMTSAWLLDRAGNGWDAPMGPLEQ